MFSAVALHTRLCATLTAVHEREIDGRALLEAAFVFLGGIFLTGDVLDGVGPASGFALVMEWAKVVLGPLLLAVGAWQLLRLYRRRRRPPEGHGER